VTRGQLGRTNSEASRIASIIPETKVAQLSCRMSLGVETYRMTSGSSSNIMSVKKTSKFSHVDIDLASPKKFDFFFAAHFSFSFDRLNVASLPNRAFHIVEEIYNSCLSSLVSRTVAFSRHLRYSKRRWPTVYPRSASLRATASIVRT
jgi:hypothetical protein